MAELTRRTSQFNLAPQPRAASYFRGLASDARCVAVDVADRFGDYGLTGVVTCRVQEGALCVDDWMLSCRVLGRGVEHRVPLLGKRMVAATVAGCVIFLILPARLGFDRAIPDDGLYRAVFSALFRIDDPHNLMPSLHVTYATLCILGCQSAAHRWQERAAWGLWLLAIVLSTVLVHQHHLLDIASGLVLAGVICRSLPENKG